MKTTHNRIGGAAILGFLGLAVLIALIFHKSFAPEQLLFANDGPLGALCAYPIDSPLDFDGFWSNLNWLGMAQPTATPNFTALIFRSIGPVYYSKFFAAICLCVLGMSAWHCLRKHSFHPMVCFAGAVAAALNMNAFSASCWGLPSRALAMATALLAIGFIRSSTINQAVPKIMLAGLAVGMGVMEAYDVGAIYSLYVAAFAIFLFFNQTSGSPALRLVKASGAVVLIAVCAVLISTQTLSSLVGTQVKGVSGMEQTVQAKEQRWNEATQWSLPKIEAIRVLIPGFFGYRMDTPDGGAYWGRVGQSPGWSQHHMGFPRYSGAGEYAGVLVVLLAVWAVVQSLRAKNSPFAPLERRIIFFWTLAGAVSLLLAFGRHAPFYQFIYALPYFSTVRNPIKFMHPFHLSLIILFAYGLQDMVRRYLHAPATPVAGMGNQVKTWWASATGFERKWIYGCAAFFLISLLGWMALIVSKPDLEKFMQSDGVDPKVIAQTIGFCVAETGWFLLFLALSLGAMLLTMTRVLADKRKVLGWIVVIGLLAADLWRANTPWIIHFDYIAKYASNSVLDALKGDKTHSRVTAPMYLASEQAPYFGAICNEWLQHQFLYYQIPCLDVSQMAREPEDHKAFMRQTFPLDSARLYLQRRLWELTSTRFILGMSGFLDILNNQFDPGQKRFRALAQFDFKQRADAGIGTEILTNGPFAVFEFTGALPRASLYTNWVANVADDAALKQLASDAFNPRATVLIADNIQPPARETQNSGSPLKAPEILALKSKRIVVETKTEQSCVLLLNDRYDPTWSATVDGQPASILRCNYLMRGVQLAPGNHRVEFRYATSLKPFYISLVGVILGVVLCGFLLTFGKKEVLS
jgi:hypothetical protein